MTHHKIRMSDQQAKDFAVLIVGDIKAYVEAHREEFEEFLRNEDEVQERGEKK